MSSGPATPLRARTSLPAIDERQQEQQQPPPMSRTPSQILAASIGAAPSPDAARALFLAHADALSSTPVAVAALASAVASSLPSVALAYDTAHATTATESTPTAAAHSSASSSSSSLSSYVASAARNSHPHSGSNAAGSNTGIAMPGAVDVAHDIVAVSPTVGNSGAFLPLEPLNFPLPAAVVAGIGAQRAADLASLATATRLAVAAVTALAKSAQFTTSAQTLARFFKARPGQPPVFASVAVDARKPTNDMEAAACAFCTRAFTMVRRRHHCRCCGDAVCFDCSTQTVVLPHLDALYAAGSEQKVCDSCFAICSFRRRGGRPDDLLAFVNESYQPAQLLPLMQYKYVLKHQVQDEMAHIVQMESSAQQQQQQQQSPPQPEQISDIVPPAQQPQYKLRRQKTTQLHEALRALRLSRGLFSVVTVMRSPSVSSTADADAMAAAAEASAHFAALVVTTPPTDSSASSSSSRQSYVARRILAVSPYPHSYITLGGVLPMAAINKAGATKCPAQFALIRSIDDIDRVTPFKIARAPDAASSSSSSPPSSAAPTTPAASQSGRGAPFASLRYDYGVTLRFKDRSELHLGILPPADAWPASVDLAALSAAQLAASMAALEQQSQEMVQASSAYARGDGSGAVAGTGAGTGAGAGASAGAGSASAATLAAHSHHAAANATISVSPAASALSQSSSSSISSSTPSASAATATAAAVVSTTLPFLCFPNGDALLAFEQDEVVQSVQRLMDRRQTTVSRQTARLAALYAQTQIKVDWANDEHHALLRRLWQLMAPPDLGANFPGTKSEQWKLLGFQGTDPQTDFRGMGELAVRCLVYFAQHHMALCQELVAAQMAGRSYPLAVAVINFCSVLGDQLRLKQFAPTASSSSASSVDPESCPLFRVFCELDDEFQFEEVLVCYVRLFDRLWVETAAGYMDFPHILSEVKARIAEQLAHRPLSSQVLADWLSATAAASPQMLEELKKKKLGH